MKPTDKSMQITILLVEDEEPIREMLALALGREGFELQEAGNGREAHNQVADRVPDLILMDWMLPDVSGIELIRQLKRDELTREVPIIMLTAKTQEDDKIHGLNSGADDYMTKPFSPRELIARIYAILRRSTGQNEDGVLAAGNLKLDTHSHRLLANDEPINISPIEFRLLRFLMSHPDRVYSRGQLLDQVWGRNTYVEERTVDVHVLRLRKSLAACGADHLIQTVRGAGYRFSLEH